MTTSPAMTVTDDLLAELEHRHLRDPDGAIGVFSSNVAAIIYELRRLRAENAELAKDAGRYCFVRRLDNDCFMLNALQRVSGDELDAAIDAVMTAIDTAMATQ